MKTLSIQQPWPWAIFYLGKPVENRDWATTFRGRILIHAGKKYDREGAEWIEEHFRVKVPRDLPTGGIVGAVNIVNCVDYGRTDYRSKWFFGRYGFVLNYATELPFKPMRGQLGFFNVDYIWPIINFEKYPEEFMNSIKRTWSGQDASAAWHWNPDTYQKLGNVVRLISTGKAEDRTKAYHEYIALKRWFFEDEFEEYISKLDAFRKEKKAALLRDIIKNIYWEMQPASQWIAKDGPKYSDIMPPLDELVPVEMQAPNGILPKPEPVPVVEKKLEPVTYEKVFKKVSIEQISMMDALFA